MLRKCIIVLALGLLLAAPASARKYKGDDTMLVSPYVFVIDSNARNLTIHTEVDFGDVDRDTVVLVGVGGAEIDPVSMKTDLRGNLVAKFTADDVRTIVEFPRTELSLCGYYKDGEPFTLTASIRIR
jgi:hypothetical protein